MPTIRQDLEARIAEELRGLLPTPVTERKLQHMVGCVTQRVSQWLTDTYEHHSLEIEVYGEQAATVARPSFEWLCENMGE